MEECCYPGERWLKTAVHQEQKEVKHGPQHVGAASEVKHSSKQRLSKPTSGSQLTWTKWTPTVCLKRSTLTNAHTIMPTLKELSHRSFIYTKAWPESKLKQWENERRTQLRSMSPLPATDRASRVKSVVSPLKQRSAGKKLVIRQMTRTLA
jgi:hypothetical protein